MRFLAVALAGLAFTAASPALAAEPLVQAVENHRNDAGEIEKRAHDFVHKQSGYIYPFALADMPARKTITFGPGDAEVYYTLKGGANGDAWLSLYIYPATLGVAEEEHEVRSALLQNLKGKAVARPVASGQPADGTFEGWYEGQHGGLDAVTGFVVARTGDYYVKVRLTIPKAGGQEALDRAARALASVDFSARGSATATMPKAVSR